MAHTQGDSFLKENNYEAVLPNDNTLTQLTKNQSKLYDAKQKEIFRKRYSTTIYSPAFFVRGLHSLKGKRDKIEPIFPALLELHNNWGFILYPEYPILLTRYGTSGNYDASTGAVIVRTNIDGSFPLNPVNTVIHEILHIGIEEIIIKKFGLTHWEKERIVDRMCLEMFPQILKDYQLQPQGEQALDSYISHKIIDNLPTAIEKYVRKRPKQ